MDEASDVRGFILNYFGQGIVLPLFLFIITTFLRILNQVAGCSTSSETCASRYDLQAHTNTTNNTVELAVPLPGNDDNCGKVWGFRPAALISFLMTVGSLTIAALMPVVGSVVDHSTYRRAIGRSSVCVVWACCAAGVAVGKHTWRAVIIFQIVVLKVAFVTNTTCVMSYLPELTADLGDGLVPVAINSRAVVSNIVAMLCYIILILLLSLKFHLGAVDQGRVASATAALVGGPILLLSWCSLTARLAKTMLPAGANLWTYGFTTIKDNVGLLYAKYHQLSRFLVVYALVEAGKSGLFSLVIIYFKEQICMATELAVGVTFLTIIFGIPGALLAKHFASGGRAKQAFTGGLFVLTVTGAVMPVVAFRPNHVIHAAVFAVFLGFMVGFIAPLQQSVLGLLIPGAMEGRVMGVCTFSAAVLVSLPSLIFGVAYEASGDMRLGFGSLFVFFGVGCGILCFGVNLSKGVVDASATMTERHGFANTKEASADSTEVSGGDTV